MVALRHLPSFPTRRSSDLDIEIAGDHQRTLLQPNRDLLLQVVEILAAAFHRMPEDVRRARSRGQRMYSEQVEAVSLPIKARRSEEHTSELQSRENLVCRLL